MSHSGRHASRPPGDQTRSPSERARALRASRRISPRTRLVLTGLLLAGLAALLLTTVRPPADGTGGLTAIAETTTGTTTGTATGRAGFDLQGHRGARGLEPENTLPAFATALALGVTTLELDVGLTLDGQVVVSHAPSLAADLTRDAAGKWLVEPTPPIRELTLAELKSYDLGRVRPDSRAARRFPRQQPRDGARFPTLAELFALAEARSRGTIRYNIETKITPNSPASPDPESLVTALLKVIDRAGVAARVTIQSFDWRSLQQVQSRAPGIPTVYLTVAQSWMNNLEGGQAGASAWLAGFDRDAQASVPALVKAAGGQIWSPYWKELSSDELKQAQALGLKVVVWTVNAPDAMARLIDLGVDGIITDYPDRLRAVMAEKALPLPTAFPGP